MESLLRWGIANTSPDSHQQNAGAPRQPLDPGVIDAILGKSDADQMRDDLAVALDAERSEDERVAALDHFEMLIEQIDNANNLEKLDMWTPLQSLLSFPTTPPSITMHTLWIIGTALQNNPAAQSAYLSLSPSPLPRLLAFLDPSEPRSTLKVRSKVVYALSGLLKHNKPALSQMDEPDVRGWERLRDALQDPDMQTRRKTVFLLNTLLIPSSSSSSAAPETGTTATLHTPSSAPPTATTVHPNSHAASLSDPSRADTSPLTLSALQIHKIIPQLIVGLVEPVPCGEDGDVDGEDAEFEEKGVRLLLTYFVECRGDVDEKDKKRIREWIRGRSGEGGEAELAERWSLSQGEIDELRRI